MANGARGDTASITQPISTAPMGVVPNQAICCNAITRPCIDGSVACCRITVSTDWNEAEAKPSGMPSARKAR